MEKLASIKRTSIISLIIFLSTFIISFISLITAVFPALILRTLGGLEDRVGIDPFEPGIWAYPILIANFIVFALLISYFKNWLPIIIRKPIRFVFNFEVSPQVAFITIMILIGIYIMFSVNELSNNKFEADYYGIFKPWLETFVFTELPEGELNRDLGHHLQIALEVLSMQIFGNYKVIPFIASIALPIMTYFITTELTKKRFAGIVAMVIVLQSGIFLFYDTSVSYPNFWILFYLLSLYLIYKKWPLSPISYVAGTLSKGLIAIFLPATLFFIYRSIIPRQKKIYVTISYVVIALAGMAFLSITGAKLNPVAENELNFHNFVSGFTAFSSGFIHDGLILLFLLPLIVGLFIASRKGIVHADSIMFLIIVMLLSAPFLSGFSENQNVPYRFVPLVVFFAIGTGILLSRKPIQQF